MQTTLSTKGQIILPAELRKNGRFFPGEKFAVHEKNGKIVLTPVKNNRNKGLVKLLRSCPHELVMPEREKNDFGRPGPSFD